MKWTFNIGQWSPLYRFQLFHFHYMFILFRHKFDTSLIQKFEIVGKVKTEKTPSDYCFFFFFHENWREILIFANFRKLVHFDLSFTPLRQSTFDLWTPLSSSGLFCLHDSFLRCPGEKQTALCAPPVTDSNVDTGLGSPGAFSFLLRPVSQPHYHGGDRQSSAPQFLLTACLLRPYPTSRAQVVPKGDCLPVNIQLFYSSIHLTSSCSI